MSRKNYFKTFSMFFILMTLAFGCKPETKTEYVEVEKIVEVEKKPDSTIPANVTELKATSKDSSILLTWKDASDEDIYGFEVSWKTESAGRATALEKDSLIVAKERQGCIVSGLTNGTEYTFTVKTMDISGNKSDGVSVKATPVAVDSKETMKIALGVPPEKSNTTITVTANITTAAQSVEKVVYKKNGSEVASKLLADYYATEAQKDASNDKKYTFTIEATDNSANGTYTVAAIDSDGREETAQIAISNFDFTPPKVVSELNAEVSTEKTSVKLTWKDPDDEDFDHVEICFVSNDDGTSDSEKSETVTVAKGEQTKDFDGIDSSKAYYKYFIVTVDSLGNKSIEQTKKVGITAVIKIPEGFVEIPAALIKGDETWSPESKIFVSGRALEIPSFYMSDHEVTRAEYKDVIGSLPTLMAAADGDADNNPVCYVNWYEAIVYCNKLSLKEGLTPCYKINDSTNPDDWGDVPNSWNNNWNAVICDFKDANGYRLPTEAEWEWAARAGKDFTYSGSNEYSEVAWNKRNSMNTTREIKTKTANAYGLYDMSGNVSELCWDWKTDEISTTLPITGPEDPTFRICRGGDVSKLEDSCEIANRDTMNPDYRDNYTGFRVVCNAR